MSGDIQISPHVGELFVKYGVRRQYRSGEVLLEKGARSAQAGFLVKGQLRTFCLGPSGDEISLFYLGPGNLFGSSALVYHAKVMVSVSAISPAEVYLLAQCDDYDSLVGMMDDIDQFTDLQAQAAVRDGTAAVEVLVVQRSEDGMLLLSGEQKGMCLRADTQPSADEARWVAAQRLRLPSHFSARYCVDAVLKALEDQTRQSLPLWLQAPMLEGELFLILDADGTAQLADKTLRYDPQVGLTEEEETHGTNGIQSAG